jgi:hypothetical protein
MSSKIAQNAALTSAWAVWGPWPAGCGRGEAVKNQRVDVPVFAGAVEGVMEARSSAAVW